MKKLSTNQKIEASREIRQWIKTIIVPGVVGTLYVDYRYPELKTNIKNFCKDKVEAVKSHFKKGEEP